MPWPPCGAEGGAGSGPLFAPKERGGGPGRAVGGMGRSDGSDMIEVELARLDRKYALLRVLAPERLGPLVGSLAASGQQVPVLVVAAGSSDTKAGRIGSRDRAERGERGKARSRRNSRAISRLSNAAAAVAGKRAPSRIQRI